MKRQTYKKINAPKTKKDTNTHEFCIARKFKAYIFNDKKYFVLKLIRLKPYRLFFTKFCSVGFEKALHQNKGSFRYNWVG